MPAAVWLRTRAPAERKLFTMSNISHPLNARKLNTAHRPSVAHTRKPRRRTDGAPHIDHGELVSQYLNETSETRRIYLDQADYRALRRLGLTRVQVEGALRRLEKAHRISLVAHNGDVLIELPIGGRP
jgi:hypothetical protein